MIVEEEAQEPTNNNEFDDQAWGENFGVELPVHDGTEQQPEDYFVDNELLYVELDERSQVIKAERQQASQAMSIQADRMLQASNTR
jgi:hypothetical protein